MQQRGFVSIDLDIESPRKSSVLEYRELQLLRRLGLARLHALEVTSLAGRTIDLKEASSGEISISLTFMSLAASLQNNSLVLIDEPETNLHPQWQAEYIDLLTSTFRQYTNCHYVLATHSPLILKDAPYAATLASLNNAALQKGESVSGKPVDYLLVEAFDVVSGENYYVQEQIVQALRLAADGEYKSVEFQSAVDTLLRARSRISDSPGVVQIIDDLEKILERGQGR